MPKKVTSDHGLIIHFAGRHHRFPVAKKADASFVRLASEDDVSADEVRVGWPAYFRAFIDQDLVFVFDDNEGQAMSREVAKAAAAVELPSVPREQ